MTSAIYPKYKDAILDGLSNVSLTGNNINISLVDSDVISYSSSNEFYANLNANGIISTVVLEDTALLNGAFSASNTEFTSFSNTETECESIIIWINTGVSTTSRLVAWLDNTSLGGLPITGSSNTSLDFTGSIFQL